MTARRVARLARYWCWLLAHDLLCGLRAYGAAMGCLQRAAALVDYGPEARAAQTDEDGEAPW